MSKLIKQKNDCYCSAMYFALLLVSSFQKRRQPIKKIRLTLVLAVIISALSITVDVHAQSESQALIDQFQFVERHRARTGYATREHREIGKLARTIGKNQNISAQIRVTVLTTVLAREIENPYSLHLIPCGYVPFSEYLKRQYIFALVDVGPEALPYLKQHLKRLKLPVANKSGSVESPQSLRAKSTIVERELILCTLGLFSDKAVYPEVMAIFLEVEDGYLRSLAAMALEKIKNKAAIPALKRALKDDFRVRSNSCVVVPNHPDIDIIYPVREAASSTLRALGVQVTRQGNDFRVVE